MGNGAGAAVLLLIFGITALLAGCGAGGYPGAGILGFSQSTITMDAGQSISVTANAGTSTVTWTIAGCSAGTCGTLSATTGDTVTYTAPISVAAPVMLSLQASVPGGQNTKSVSVTVNPALTISNNLPTGTVGQPYTATITTTGGTSPVKLSLPASATLPAGLTFNASTGVVSGTPTAAGTTTFEADATDASNVPLTVKTNESITISAGAGSGISVTGTPAAGAVGTAYNATLGATGGTGPYTFTVTGGALPGGLTLSNGGAISGTPTTAGSFTFTVQAQDSLGAKGTGNFTITITASALAITTGTLPNGTVGTPYTATVGVSGGAAPYSCTVTVGTLPAGLSMGAGCVVSGTPTTPGTVTVTVHATDSSAPAMAANGQVSITIIPATLAIGTGTLPNGTVGAPYTATVGVTGGTGPYTCTVTSGTLPAGLSMGAGCVVSGTPTVAGTQIVMVHATDSSNPMMAANGPVSITINPAGSTLALSNPPPATAGSPYTGTIGVSGGTAPYSCSITSGTLPAGLNLGANCAISGTPTTPGSATVTVHATDSSSPAQSTTGPVTVTVNPASATLTLSNPPPATIGSPYTGSIGVSGGTGPYSCTITSGTLSDGMTLGAGCALGGTPTATAITAIVTVHATDSGNPAATVTGPVTVTVNPASATLTLSSPPAATVGLPYTGTIGVSGGTGPYSCTITAGTLPAGLTLGANCTISGTPTTPGPVTVTVQATDSSTPVKTASGPVTITVNGGTLTLSNPPAATAGTPYTGAIGVSGGTAPYSCVLAGGTLPAGLTLGPNCTLTGTPTTAGASTVSITATDSETPAATTTGPVTITVNPMPVLTLTGSLPNATVGVPYTQTLHAAGGMAPYTYAITAGALPPGLTMSTAGVISGTPTAPGASSFTVTATDSETPAKTASLPLVLLVVYPTTAQDGLLNGPYAFLFQGFDDQIAGVLNYQTATIGSFTADGTGVINTGELDTNHQTSNPTATTVATNSFLGTYTIGTDDRGMLTVTTMNADGTTGPTSTYAIDVKAATAPATTSIGGSMIEFDNDQLRGTKGTGQFLQQTPGAYAAGLNGNYAFGMQGDTPCLPACSVGISAGPAAAVGAFTANGAGGITGGTGDANVSQTNYPNNALAGTYGAADSNGRMALSLTTANVPLGAYPVDYAVYMVNANQAFVMSTDKHSAYILLAGNMHAQTGTFSNATMTGPYVGYENSPTNPGLVGATLQNVASLSTSTIFRGTGNGTGTCTTTNVDVGGTTGLVNGLTGLGSGAPVINALLGTYQSTGDSGCTVAANGRGVLNYPVPSTVLTGTLLLLNLPTTPPPPRVVYFWAPNEGYFLETGYAGLGYLEAQTGAPFSLATLDGTYVYQQIPAASAASTDTSGNFTADGAGHTTSTYDLNTGVGAVNVLQLGLGNNQNYTLTDPTAGRYLLGTTTVIYAISPSRFVLLDTNPAITSPSVALLY